MLTTILISLIIIVLFLMGRVFWAKFPILANIDAQNLKVEKQAEVKIKMAENRVKNKIDEMEKKYKNSFLKNFFDFLKNIYNKILHLEKKYKNEKEQKRIINLKDNERQGTINSKIQEADNLLDDENYDLAEEKYIEIIAVDNKNVLAYLGLAKVYFAKGDFEHAKELYEYVLKIDAQSDRALVGLGNIALKKDNPDEAREKYEHSIKINSNPEHYVDLATAYYKLSSPGKALTAIRRAHELEPKNPKYLDFLIEAAILNKNKILALDSYKKLEQINPENSKLIEFKKRIREM